jgi:hypothetical protein
VLRELAEMRVTRREFRPRIADTDNGPAVEFVVRNALVLHPASVHEAVLVRGAEPLLGAQFGFRSRHRLCLFSRRNMRHSLRISLITFQ